MLFDETLAGVGVCTGAVSITIPEDGACTTGATDDARATGGDVGAMGSEAGVLTQVETDAGRDSGSAGTPGPIEVRRGMALELAPVLGPVAVPELGVAFLIPSKAGRSPVSKGFIGGLAFFGGGASSTS